MKELFDAGKKIIETLKAHYFEAYFVGGAVRDYVMNRTIHDIDITTNAVPEEIESLFDYTFDVGKEHGTIVVLINHIPFEVTTYRCITAANSKLETASPDLKTDLQHRDFSMNAMAMTEDNELYDPFGGRQSIQQQEIQAVGSAHDRFCEDPLRMLRAIRFMSTLNFTLSQHIIDAIKIHNEKMSNVAVERIVVELQKMYSGEGIESAKKWLVRTNLVHYLPFFKELKRSLTDSSVNNFLDELLLQIHFDHNLKTSLKTLKLSNKDQHVIKDMLKLLNDLKTGLHPKLVAFKYSRETLNRLTVISAHNHILNTSETVSLDTSIAAQPLLPIQHRQDLAIRGKAILETYATSGGPWVKEMLSVLEEAVIFEKVKNNQDDLIDWMKANVIIKDRHIKIIE